MTQKKGGFHYHVSQEQIDEYQKLSTKDKLEWLEEALKFSYESMSPETWETWQKFRRGEI